MLVKTPVAVQGSSDFLVLYPPAPPVVSIYRCLSPVEWSYRYQIKSLTVSPTSPPFPRAASMYSSAIMLSEAALIVTHDTEVVKEVSFSSTAATKSWTPVPPLSSA